MGFATGLLTGIAQGANKVISQDIEAAKLETRQLARLRAERTMQRQDRREELYRENLETTQKLAAQLGPGGEAILRHYIQKGGLPYAEEATARLVEYTRANNTTPAKYAGIVVGEGDLPTPQQLAEMATAPVQPLTPVKSNVGGWAGILGIGGSEEVQRLTDQYVSTVSSTPREIGEMPKKRNLSVLDQAIPTLQTPEEMKTGLLRKQYNLSKKLSDPNLNPEDKLIYEQENNKLKSQLTMMGEYNRLSSGEVNNLGRAFDKEVIENGMSPRALQLLEYMKVKNAMESSSTGLRRGTYLPGNSIQAAIRQERADLRNTLGLGKGKFVLPRQIYDPDKNELVIHSPKTLGLMRIKGDIKIIKKWLGMANAGGTDVFGDQVRNTYAKELQTLEQQVVNIEGEQSDEDQEPSGGLLQNNTATSLNNMPANKREEADRFLSNFKQNPGAKQSWQKRIARGDTNKLIESIKRSGKTANPPIEYTTNDALNILNRISALK